MRFTAAAAGSLLLVMLLTGPAGAQVADRLYEGPDRPQTEVQPIGPVAPAPVSGIVPPVTEPDGQAIVPPGEQVAEQEGPGIRPAVPVSRAAPRPAVEGMPSRVPLARTGWSLGTAVLVLAGLFGGGGLLLALSRPAAGASGRGTQGR
jgi:hypothetical protein